MAANKSRDEDNARRKDRQKSVARGAGVFVYDGSLFDTEWVPTPKLVGKNTPKVDSRGMPVIGRDGRQVFEPANKIETDSNGRVVMGGEPEKRLVPIDTFKIWGAVLPANEPVYVEDARLALKLRGMDGFDELVGEEAAPFLPKDGPAKKKRGRKAKAEDSAAQ